MENVSVLNFPLIPEEKIDGADFNKARTTKERTGFSPAIIKVIAEGGENLFLYLKKLNFMKESNMLVLSSVHHFFYDETELKGVKTLVNLKKLNNIKQLDMFLNSLSQMLPEDANFIGCFSNDMSHRQNGFSFYKASRLWSRFINLIDSRTDQFLDNKKVTEAFEKNGLMIVDMVEMDGLTYFYSKVSAYRLN
jgi:hypothetical protein